MPVPISLRPIHIEMLKELEVDQKANRSAVIQGLIENSYKEYVDAIVRKRDGL
jgi:hypothetical protein